MIILSFFQSCGFTSKLLAIKDTCLFFNQALNGQGRRERQVFDLHPVGKILNFLPMKFTLAILIYVVIALILGEGILQLVAGKPWLLIIGSVGFIVAFARIGCKSH